MADPHLNKRAWKASDVLRTEYPIVMRVGQVQHHIERDVALEYVRQLRHALADSDETVTTALEVATDTELLAELRKRLEKVR